MELGTELSSDYNNPCSKDKLNEVFLRIKPRDVVVLNDGNRAVVLRLFGDAAVVGVINPCMQRTIDLCNIVPTLH